MRLVDIKVIITILVYNMFAVYGGDLPPEIHKCKSTDTDNCVGKTIEQIIQLYPNGNPQFGMPSIVAMNLTNIKISRSISNSPIQINFEFIKCTIDGLEKLQILRTSGFDKELKNVQLDANIPNLRLRGDYESSGKILLLPINGQGKGDIQLKECNIQIRVKVELEKRYGKNYAKIKQFKAVITPKQMFVKLANILKDNPVLSDSINDVINENWKDVWTELQEGINQAMEQVLTNIMSGVLKELSTEDFYSD